MIHLNYRDARPIYAQIVDGFQEQIRSGVLRVGDRLPSVRELAQLLAINPNTIQRAYRELEQKNWIATVPGKGCFVHGAAAEIDTDRQVLLEEFDRLTAALLESGLTRQNLIERLQKEEAYND